MTQHTKHGAKKTLKHHLFGDSIWSIVLAVALAVVIRTFAFQAFVIPSGSMKPNLLISDFLFVSKYSFGYSNFSLPFSPKVFEGRVLQFEHPKVGDIVVFRGPRDPDTDYIKRVVGLPGDRVQMRDGILHINGQPCPVKPMGTFTDDLWTKQVSPNDDQDIRYTGQENERHIPLYEETLPNGVRHLILKKDPFGESTFDNTQEYIVPEGHYFMMGDNRDESGDSRILSKIGYVPADHLIGKAQLVWFSTTARWWEFWKWPISIRYKRLLKFIQDQ